jgi:hypothetical protein
MADEMASVKEDGTRKLAALVLVTQSVRYLIQAIDIPVWASAAAIWNLDPFVSPSGLKNSKTVWCMA